MTDEAWRTLGIYGTLLAVIIRSWKSHFEHKKTEGKVDEIHSYMNGEMTRKTNEAREEGRQEERDKNI